MKQAYTFVCAIFTEIKHQMAMAAKLLDHQLKTDSVCLLFITYDGNSIEY